MKTELTHGPLASAAQTPDLRNFISHLVDWLVPVGAKDEPPATPASPQEVEALERQIQKFTEELMFSGFPC